MFGATAIGFLVGLSVSVWVYNKTMRQTGNNTQSSAILAGLAGFGAFIVIITLVWTADAMLGA